MTMTGTDFTFLMIGVTICQIINYIAALMAVPKAQTPKEIANYPENWRTLNPYYKENLEEARYKALQIVDNHGSMVYLLGLVLLLTIMICTNWLKTHA